MAIMQGITGKLSGKMGSAVFRVRKGAQVVAQYNPNVSNPKSKGQNDQRAKFKMASQLAAEIGDFMAFNPQTRAGHGTPTQRNEFIKANLPEIDIVGTDNPQAKIALAGIKLTNSSRPFSADISATAEGGTITVGYIVNDPTITQIAVVLMAIRQDQVINGDGTMSVLSRPERRDAQIISVNNGRATTGFEYNRETENPNIFAVLTYGIIPTSSARVTFSDNAANVVNDFAFATNNIQRSLRQNNIQVTETRGLPATPID